MKHQVERIEIPMGAKGGHLAIHHFKAPPPRKGLSSWESRKEPETHVFPDAKSLGAHVSKMAGGEAEAEPAK